ncbi:MAG: tRNA (N6-isopentenyl adenosine(37)-C2)-methylthiotransferase MiaB, partial [Heliobacteriaceae bacterium]|nr:tRNA (N6-isopentenyl adenosine(37)-C2)-methylthiotransferase MiaB [Heliobacteriaceae bacterium]
RPEVIIGIGGCMVQQPGMPEKIATGYPYVDLVFGTHNWHRIPVLLAEILAAKKPKREIWTDAGPIVENLPKRRVVGVKAFVTIMYGCNNFCSYCIVPYVRGRERSRVPEVILAEIRELVHQGIKEVTLLGQNVNSYGKDLVPVIVFADLLKMVNKVPGLARIRFATSHPKDFDPRLIEAMAGAGKVCKHIHLPVQAGSDQVLRAMNRGYTRDYYLSLVDNIRKTMPEVALTTDIIVGYPGETAADFEDTLHLVETARFDNAFTFLYSPRTGTPAAEKEQQVSPEIKKNRFQRLLHLQHGISLEHNQALVGQVIEVLVEGPSKNKPAVLTGRTRGNKIVVFPGNSELIGQLIGVRIETARTWTLTGQVTET